MIDSEWTHTLVEEMDGESSHKKNAKDLVALLSEMSEQPSANVSHVSVEVGDQIPDTEAPLGDFAPSTESTI